MKIALIYEKFLSRGGLEGYLWGLARALRSAGHQITVVTSRMDGETRKFDAEFVVLPGAGWGGTRLRSFARRASDWADQGECDAVAGFGRTYRQDVHRAGGGCHKVYSRQLPIWKRWSPKNRAELALEKKLYTGGGTRLFVVNSTMVAEQLQREYGVRSDRIQVVHTAVDQERFHPAAKRETHAEPVFFFVSMNHERKGLDVLLDHWSQVPGVLWIAGPRLKGRFRRKAAKLGDRVVELGEEADLPARYRAADWFLHPTKYDACANTVLQALASGLPGLISTRDGAAEFLRDGENGWLLRDPEDGGEVVRAVEKMARLSEVEREPMARAARSSVRDLTWDAHVTAWERILMQLTKDSF